MSRAPLLRASFDLLPGELVVDNFAGGGGASTGIESAIGRPVDIAINHSPEAIAMHRANHPETKHYCENIWEVDPREAAAGRPIGLAWFSPDCTHFSRAKGTQPVKKEIRGLAEVVIRWAREVRPRIILLENVEEFQTWGPLLNDQPRPDPTRAGETFRAWLAALTDLGYKVEFRILVAADYGTPTTRKRLFLVARCDGVPIVWPTATHGKGRATAWRPASEIIDWSLPCPSIFDRKKPLAEATLRRIATGIRRYVVEAASPFILPVKSWGGGNGPRSIGDPMRTVTASKRGEFAIAQPFIAPLTHQGGARGRSAKEPLATVTAAHRGELALVAPFAVRTGHYSNITGAGLREGCGAGTFRGQQLGLPLGTVCATNDKHVVEPVLAPVLLKHYGGVVGHGVDRTLGTVTAVDHHSLATAWIAKLYGTSTGSDVAAPLPTVTGGGGHLAEVRAFLVKYYGAEGRDSAQQVLEPLHTITTKARFGLVQIHGEAWEIVDIGMRMLQPHELFAAQGFPADYDITPDFNGRPLTKTAQTMLAGNSVCPQVSDALVAANARAARRAVAC